MSPDEAIKMGYKENFVTVITEVTVSLCMSEVHLTRLVAAHYVTEFQHQIPFRAGWALAVLSSRELGSESEAFCLRVHGTQIAR